MAGNLPSSPQVWARRVCGWRRVGTLPPVVFQQEAVLDGLGVESNFLLTSSCEWEGKGYIASLACDGSWEEVKNAWNQSLWKSFRVAELFRGSGLYQWEYMLAVT